MNEQHPEQTILSLSTVYWVSRCLRVVAELGIADALGDEPQPAVALAASTATHPDALHRMLRALANHGVFRLDAGRFSHNAASRLLRSNNPASMRSLARMMGASFHWDAYRELGHSLVTGESAASKAVPGGLFGHLRAHPEDGKLFNEAMVAKSFAQIGPLLGVYDFRRFRTIGDIGGGMGHLLSAILDTAPASTGVLFELPEVSRRPVPRRTRASVTSRAISSRIRFRRAMPTC